MPEPRSGPEDSGCLWVGEQVRDAGKLGPYLAEVLAQHLLKIMRYGERGTSMTDNTAFLEGLYGSFAKGDVPTVLAAMDPEVEWNEAEHVTFWTGKPFVGPDAVAQGVFALIPETFGDTFRIEITQLLDCGSPVVMEGHYKGTVQSTGKDLDVQVTTSGTSPTARSSSSSSTPTPGNLRRPLARRR